MSKRLVYGSSYNFTHAHVVSTYDPVVMIYVVSAHLVFATVDDMLDWSDYEKNPTEDPTFPVFSPAIQDHLYVAFDNTTNQIPLKDAAQLFDFVFESFDEATIDYMIAMMRL